MGGRGCNTKEIIPRQFQRGFFSRNVTFAKRITPMSFCCVKRMNNVTALSVYSRTYYRERISEKKTLFLDFNVLSLDEYNPTAYI